MDISVYGARVHNLKSLDVSIPRDKFVVVTGVSGSGKSSLVFDTIFAEAQREFLESLSTYARTSLPKINKPDVDSIEGLSPCIVIDQRPLAKNPRSTVGTLTEIYSFLRLLYSRLGHPIISAGEFSFNTPAGACPKCSGLGQAFLPDLNRLIHWNKSLKQGAIQHRTWKVDSRYWNIINSIGYFDMNKPLREFTKEELDILLYSDPIQYKNKSPGYVQSFSFEGIVKRMIKRQNDSRGLSVKDYDQQFFHFSECMDCGGTRLNERARSVAVNGLSMAQAVQMEIIDLLPFVSSLHGDVANSITPFVVKKVENCIQSGLGYLHLNRSISSLSGGEAQRLKIAKQLGSSLSSIIYVLDEPTSGLHPRDIDNLVLILKELVKKRNTIITVEHDGTVMEKADHIIDIGPGAGVLGGKLVAHGSPEEMKSKNCTTGDYLSGRKSILRKVRRKNPRSFATIKDATLHNLKNVTVSIPLNFMTCITGVSGSGKSSLMDVFVRQNPAAIIVDQSAVGNNPRSIPATYVGSFDAMRREFAEATGTNESLFSFNGRGACGECDGLGYKVMDMHFLGDVQLPCEICKGKRYNEEVLNYRYKGKTIADVLDMTIDETVGFFRDREVERSLTLLSDVGLGYLKIGQPLNTLSGGESQRVKLTSRLNKKGNIYVLDEPTKGLHVSDIERLLYILYKLVDRDNTVIVIEHNLDVIKNADWVIDLGPEGGRNGGQIVAQGPPEEIAESAESITGRYLEKALNGHQV